MSKHLGDLLGMQARERPLAPAVIGPAGELSRAEVHEAAGRAASALHDLGVEPGDRVLMAGASSTRFLTSWLGVLYAGATVVPISSAAAPAEVRFRARHARARLALVDGERLELMSLAGVSATELDALDATREVAPRHSPDGLAMVLYTSGTTGVPKGAAIGHASLVRHTCSLVEHVLRFDADSVVLAALPLAHSFGIRMGVLAPLIAGARVVLPSTDRFDAEATLRLCGEHGVTWLPGVPTMFHAWAGTEGPPISTLEWALSAGAPLAEDVRRRASRRLGAEVRQGYGLTEATFTCIDAPPDDPTAGSVGRPVPGVQVRLRAVAESGRAESGGDVGEVLVSGDNVMDGYLDDPEATRAIMGDGWVRTGDLGRLDAGGRLTIVDRLKDLILRGGHNVYPAEVENVLATHASVVDVAVIGRPDDRLGEEVVAVLVVDEAFEPAAMASWIRERLAATKAPREYALVDALPLGPSRKVLRRALRDRIRDGELPLHTLR